MAPLEGRTPRARTSALRRLALAAWLGASTLLTTASSAFAQGATTPFVTYEAEEGSLGGSATVRALAAPLMTWSDSPEAEASGRAFVQLQNTGDSVTLPNHTAGPVSAIDFRYSIPDAPAGGGITSTLNLYVDGVFRQSLYVTSKQTWVYAGTSWDGTSQDPSVGNPHIFFDEGHAFISGAPVAPGSVITFQKDAANTASFYWIDCVDLEAPPPPLMQPAGSISITDNGAVATTLTDPIPDDAVDSTSAIQNTINAASAQGKSVWIPQGRFIVTGAGLTATGVTIEGAGMWYSAVYRNLPLPVPATSNVRTMWEVSSVTMRDFLIDSNAQSRESADGDSGGITMNGTNWLVENIWVQHCSSGLWGAGTGGIARNSRMLSTWGDGININNGSSGGTGNNLTVVNNYVRGAGDDGVTINSASGAAQMENATLKNNTTVSIYWAHSLGVYGGNNDVVEDNLLCDPANFPAILVSIFNGAPLESGIVEGNVIVRGGGDDYTKHQAAIEIGSNGSPDTATVGNVQFLNNVIIDSMQKAVEFTSSSSITFANNVIDGLWVSSDAGSSLISAIDIEANMTGSAVFTSNTLQDLLPGQITFFNASASGFQTSGAGNVGFDPGNAGPTVWMSGSDAGAARRTARCTTPVSLVLDDAGSPEGGSDGGSGSPESGTGTSEDAGIAAPPVNASGDGAASVTAQAGSTGGCGCAVPGLVAKGGSPGLPAVLAWLLGCFLRRRRPQEVRERPTTRGRLARRSWKWMAVFGMAFILGGVRSAFALPSRLGCIGDSITEGVGASSPTKDWVSDLSGMLDPSVTVGNYGVSGTTMMMVSNSSYWSTGDLPKVETFLITDGGANEDVAVIIMLGTNDSKDSAGVDNWNATAPTRYAADYDAMIDALQGLTPTPDVFLALPPPAFVNSYGIDGTVIADQIIPIIVAIATTRKLPVIDVHSPLVGMSALFPDGVHPNDQGHMEIATIMYDGLRTPTIPTSDAGTPDAGTPDAGTPDAGTPGDAASQADATLSGDGAAPTAPASPNDAAAVAADASGESAGGGSNGIGCGCKAAPSRSPTGLVWAVAAMFWAVRARRSARAWPGLLAVLASLLGRFLRRRRPQRCRPPAELGGLLVCLFAVACGTGGNGTTINDASLGDGNAISEVNATAEIDAGASDVAVADAYPPPPPAGDRQTLELSGNGWVLWPDRKASWMGDIVYPVAPDVSTLPVNAPTGGWDALFQNVVPVSQAGAVLSNPSTSLQVSVPGTVEGYLWDAISGGAGAGTSGNYIGVSWWGRDFTVSSFSGKTVKLWIENARYRCEVYVNQTLVGYDAVGNLPFVSDITSAVTEGTNKLALRITDPGGDEFSWGDYSPPIAWGAQSVLRGHDFGGVMGSVTLMIEDPVHITDIYVKNQPTITDVEADIEITNESTADWTGPVTLDIVNPVSGGSSVLHQTVPSVTVPAGQAFTQTVDLSMPNARLWDVGQGNLYGLNAVLGSASGPATGDGQEQSFGFRWFEVNGMGSAPSDVTNAMYRLNGKRIVLKSAISWGYFPANGMFAMPDIAAQQVATAQALGLNMLNFHRCVGQTVILDAADQAGLLYFEEPGGYSSYYVYLFGTPYDDDGGTLPRSNPDLFGIGRQMAQAKLTRMIRRDRSHPSLIIVNMVNEAAINPIAEAVSDQVAAHALDPNLVTTYSSGFESAGHAGGNKLFMLPNDSTQYDYGYTDIHNVGGPGVYVNSIYRGPDEYERSTTDANEILFYGEEDAIATLPRLEKLYGNYTSPGALLGWDGSDYIAWYNGFTSYITTKNLSTYFPSLDSFTLSTGDVSYYLHGRTIENERINNLVNGFALNGWECEKLDNFSGIVDQLREPKSGNTQLLTDYTRPLYVALKAYDKIGPVGGTVTLDAWIVNENALPGGSYSLQITSTVPGGATSPLYSGDVTVTGGDVFGELLVQGQTVSLDAGAGYYNLKATLSQVAGTQVADGHEEILAVNWQSMSLPKGGAIASDNTALVQFLNETEKLGLPIFDGTQGTLQYIVASGAVGSTAPIFTRVHDDGTILFILDQVQPWMERHAHGGHHRRLLRDEGRDGVGGGRVSRTAAPLLQRSAGQRRDELGVSALRQLHHSARRTVRLPARRGRPRRGQLEQ